VTRLGEFSPNRHGSFRAVFLITEEAQIFGLHTNFDCLNYVFNLTKRVGQHFSQTHLVTLFGIL
jgi:hypothetical protein